MVPPASNNNGVISSFFVVVSPFIVTSFLQIGHFSMHKNKISKFIQPQIQKNHFFFLTTFFLVKSHPSTQVE
jgi:hypothetical protein